MRITLQVQPEGTVFFQNFQIAIAGEFSKTGATFSAEGSEHLSS